MSGIRPAIDSAVMPAIYDVGAGVHDRRAHARVGNGWNLGSGDAGEHVVEEGGVGESSAPSKL